MILVGDCRVGKTSYLNYIVNKGTIGKAQSQPPTIGVEYAPAKTRVRGQEVKVNLWDTCTYKDMQRGLKNTNPLLRPIIENAKAQL